MARTETSVLDELGLRGGAEAAVEGAPDEAPGIMFGVDRLIGDQPVRWWALAGSWLAVAFSVGFGLFVNYQAGGREDTFVQSVMAVIPHYAIWVLASPPLYRALHMTIERRRRLVWSLVLAGWSVAALAGSTLASFLSYAIRHELTPSFELLNSIYLQPPAAPAFHAFNLSILALALCAFAVIRGLRLRDQALWKAAQAEVRGARLEAQLAEARLQVLQAQINPHFLLNSLNAIAGLVRIGERDRAFDAIGKIGELLQVALRNGRALDVTLHDEVEFLERYLNLCELRFGAHFRYTLTIPESLQEARLPALVVQPLIENSLRHGMEPPRVLTVDIRAWREGRRLLIEVEDDGRGISGAGAGLRAGHGLANVAERLRLYFGAGAALTIEPRSPAGTRVRLVCPLGRHPSPEYGGGYSVKRHAEISGLRAVDAGGGDAERSARRTESE